MTDVEAALLKLIDEDPTNQTAARLVYADWLEQNGKSALARWIRDDIAYHHELSIEDARMSATSALTTQSLAWALRVLIKPEKLLIREGRLESNDFRWMGFDIELGRTMRGVDMFCFVRYAPQLAKEMNAAKNRRT